MSYQASALRTELPPNNLAAIFTHGTAPTAVKRPIGQTLPASPPAMVAKGGLAPWQIKRVLSHIEEHLGERLRIAELAVLSKLSVSYFSVAFSQSFGVTVHAFIMRRRIDRAKTLMISTAEQLSRIAIECGFCDQAHLSRQFRRMIGNTPTRWRRTHSMAAVG